jgi:hypothetical protein
VRPGYRTRDLPNDDDDDDDDDNYNNNNNNIVILVLTFSQLELNVCLWLLELVYVKC